MKRPIYSLWVSIALTGCGGGDETQLPIPTTLPAATSATPNAGPALSAGAASTPPSTAGNLAQLQAADLLDRSSSIAGPDLDSDGVRDDINRWINKQSFNEKQKEAVTKMARTMQEMLLVDSADKEAARAAAERDSAAMDCVRVAFELKSPVPRQLAFQIEAMTANTRERAQRYIQYNAALNGMAFDMPSKPTCD